MKGFPRDTSIKLNFWHYQGLGFALYISNEFSRNWSFFTDSWAAIFYLTITITLFFLLTLGLRLIFRPLYKLQWSPIFYILLISVTSLICALIWQELKILVSPMFGLMVVPRSTTDFIRQVIFGTWPPFVWSILYFGIKYWQDLQDERERYKASLLLATKTQLQVLRSQINPHFC